MALSKTKVDRLGDRLKAGSHTEDDLRMLDEYRRSLGEAYESVVGALRRRGALPTGRLAKTTLSIVAKLRRENVRLSQMQDIAGCRVVVGDVLQQDRFVESLKADFPEMTVIDRRKSPSHGYRAVHVVVKISGKLIEIQVRTTLQHLWAEVSEKLSDVLDATIKYGGGEQKWQGFLAEYSNSVRYYEIAKAHTAKVRLGQIANEVTTLRRRVAEKRKRGAPDPKLEARLRDKRKVLKSCKQLDKELREELARRGKEITDALVNARVSLEQMKGQKQ